MEVVEIFKGKYITQSGNKRSIYHILQLTENTFIVYKDGNLAYQVHYNKTQNVLTCTCEAEIYYEDCKHKEMVKMFLNQE